ncbi:hypothetical protein [Vibrio celticus]|uniref:Uncharacterized protein n=1 Tax=Vibrio celticus TaxID=446372 RepID=A0A1C3JIX7_9VIBR|nr:hypothetical protein [Vibrio celticus]SBT15077.1 hypothetical protein VCE7224_03860 [Vibrio celticus]
MSGLLTSFCYLAAVIFIAIPITAFYFVVIVSGTLEVRLQRVREDYGMQFLSALPTETSELLYAIAFFALVGLILWGALRQFKKQIMVAFQCLHEECSKAAERNNLFIVAIIKFTFLPFLIGCGSLMACFLSAVLYAVLFEADHLLYGQPFKQTASPFVFVITLVLAILWSVKKYISETAKPNWHFQVQNKHGKKRYAGFIRPTTALFVVGTMLYLVFEISFNLNLMRYIATDSIHFYSNLDTIGRLLSGIGVSLILVRMIKYSKRLKEDGVFSFRMTLLLAPVFTFVIAGVFLVQGLVVDLVVSAVPKQVKVNVVENFLYARYHHLTENEGMDGDGDYTQTIQKALIPFMAVTGMTNYQSAINKLTDEERIKQLTAVNKEMFSTNEKYYQDRGFAPRALPKHDGDNRKVYNMSRLDMSYLQSKILGDAYGSLSASAIRKEQEKAYKAYRDGYREELRGYSTASDGRRNKRLRSALARQRIYLPSDWNHDQLTVVREAIFEKVESDLRSSAFRTVRAFGKGVVIPTTSNPLQEKEVQDLLMQITKGWYFDSARKSALRYSGGRHMNLQNQAASVAEYQVRYPEDDIEDKFRGLLAPTLALVISLLLISVNVFNLVWMITKDYFGSFVTSSVERERKIKMAIGGGLVAIVLSVSLFTDTAKYVMELFAGAGGSTIVGYLFIAPLLVIASTMEMMSYLFGSLDFMMNFANMSVAPDVLSLEGLFHSINGESLAANSSTGLISWLVFAWNMLVKLVGFSLYALPLAVIGSLVACASYRERLLDKPIS